MSKLNLANKVKGVSAIDAFLGQNKEVLQEIDIDKIIDNKLNLFNMEENEEFENLVKSIERQGILQPLLLKKNEDDETYIIISGHRRKRAAEKAGLETVPAIVKYKNYTSDEELLDLIETNVTTRKLTTDDILNTIDMILNIIKEDNIKIEGKTTDYVGKMLNLSGKQIQRYKNLNNLLPEFKEMIDNEELTVTSAQPIAKLTAEEQKKALEKIADKTASGEKITGKIVNEIKDEVINEKDDSNKSEKKQKLSKEHEQQPEEPTENLDGILNFEKAKTIENELNKIVNTYISTNDRKNYLKDLEAFKNLLEQELIKLK